MISIIPRIDTTDIPIRIRISMFCLSIFSVLSVYKFPFLNISYGYFINLLVFIFFVKSGYSNNKYLLPTTYIVFWAYCALQLLYISGLSAYQNLLPGGIQFFLFSISLVGFSVNFNMECLRKYVNLVWCVASALFLIQWISAVFLGHPLSFFLPIANELYYGDITYRDVVQTHLLAERFSSIFIEPSYFGQYSLLAMALDLFCEKNKSHFVTPYSVAILLILLLLRSGVGFLGTGVILLAKILYLVIFQGKRKYLFYLWLLIPFAVGFIAYYLTTSAGDYVMDRMEQMRYTEGDTSSGNVRLYYGYLRFGLLNYSEQMWGIADGFREIGQEGVFMNGISTFLCRYGYVGCALLLLFIIVNSRKRQIAVVILSILFIVISAMESTYLGHFMMICCASLCTSVTLKK